MSNQKLTFRHSTLCFFDWDDTILPSTYLAAKGYRLDSAEIDEETLDALAILEDNAIALLQGAFLYGTVVIVTNAEAGWVELSAEKFYPKLRRMILPHVEVCSARTKYEKSFPDSPLKWKYYTFRDYVVHLKDALKQRDEVDYDVISLGDSQYEREAILEIRNSNLDPRLVKSIKFLERPGPHHLLEQIKVVCKLLLYVVTHFADLDLQLYSNREDDMKLALVSPPKVPQVQKEPVYNNPNTEPVHDGLQTISKV